MRTAQTTQNRQIRSSIPCSGHIEMSVGTRT